MSVYERGFALMYFFMYLASLGLRLCVCPSTYVCVRMFTDIPSDCLNTCLQLCLVSKAQRLIKRFECRGRREEIVVNVALVTRRLC